MFNQKVNYYTVKNPSYLNTSISGVNGVSGSQLMIHNCGTTINKYNKTENCGNLPLQTWCSKNVAVESFAMRPIVNSKEYFENIKSYLSSIILNDSNGLNASGLARESYVLMDNYDQEPMNSFLQTLKLDIVNKLNLLMANSSDNINMFSQYNPICEGFVITDVDIGTYSSTTNPNHFFHNVVFGAVNTTRYNTVSFRAQIYQDATPIMSSWNKAIGLISSSKDITKDVNVKATTLIYVFNINLLNNTDCVLGQENDCEVKGYNVYDMNNVNNAQLLNQNMLIGQTDNSWLQPNSLSNSYYDLNGNYDINGEIKIIDSGPPDLDNLIKELN